MVWASQHLADEMECAECETTRAPNVLNAKTVSIEAPLGRVEVSVGTAQAEAWVGVGRETVVEIG